MNDQKRAYIYAGLAIFFWSTVATAFKIGLRYLNPQLLVMYASLTSFLLMLVIVISQKKLKKLMNYSIRDYSNSLILGLLNPFLYYLILFRAYSLLPAQVAQPLNMVWPIVLVFLSGPFLGQKIGLRSYIALSISFVGVMFVSSQGDFFGFKNSNTLGLVLAVGSSLIWSFFFIFNVRDKRDEELKLLLNFFFASLFIVGLNLVTGNFKIPESKGLLAAAYIGLFEMGFAFIFWLKALKYSRSSDLISNLVYLAPFLSLVFIHYILGENIFATTFIGLILIVAGILYQKVRLRNRKAR